MTDHSKIRTLCLVGGILISTLYGSTYQQFRHFNPNDTRGASDSISYLSMASGDYDVNPVHRYRFITPYLASKVHVLLHAVSVEPDSYILSFYIVNFCFAFFTSVIIFFILESLGFSFYLSLLGSMLFTSSRITALVVGAPLTDSIYFLSIAVIVFLTQRGAMKTLCVLAPILILTKETTLPFLLLPFARKEMRSKWLITSIVLSVGLFIIIRRYLAEASPPENNPSLFSIVTAQLWLIKTYLLHLFSLRGVVDITNGFSFLLVLALIGFLVNIRASKYHLPNYIIATMPISICFAMLSGNLGRMFFASFLVVIPYALICVEHYGVPGDLSK